MSTICKLNKIPFLVLTYDLALRFVGKVEERRLRVLSAIRKDYVDADFAKSEPGLGLEGLNDNVRGREGLRRNEVLVRRAKENCPNCKRGCTRPL